jgi:hypothetical protein
MSDWGDPPRAAVSWSERTVTLSWDRARFLLLSPLLPSSLATELPGEDLRDDLRVPFLRHLLRPLDREFADIL